MPIIVASFEDSNLAAVLPNANPGGGLPWLDPVSGAIIVGVKGTFGVTDHGALSGLGDDDHPQYAKKAGDVFCYNGSNNVGATAINKYLDDAYLIQYGASGNPGNVLRGGGSNNVLRATDFSGDVSLDGGHLKGLFNANVFLGQGRAVSWNNGGNAYNGSCSIIGNSGNSITVNASDVNFSGTPRANTFANQYTNSQIAINPGSNNIEIRPAAALGINPTGNGLVGTIGFTTGAINLTPATKLFWQASYGAPYTDSNASAGLASGGANTVKVVQGDGATLGDAVANKLHVGGSGYGYIAANGYGVQIGNGATGSTITTDISHVTTLAGVLKFPASGANVIQMRDQSAGTFANVIENGFYTFNVGRTDAVLNLRGPATFNGTATFVGYTFATVPSASANAGATIRITDRSHRLATSDGTNWNWAGTTTPIS